MNSILNYYESALTPHKQIDFKRKIILIEFWSHSQWCQNIVALKYILIFNKSLR